MSAVRTIKVLFVEKDDGLKPLIINRLKHSGKQATILFAHTYKESVKILEENPDIEIVSLGGRFANESDTQVAATLKLIPIIREKLGAVEIIAASAAGDYNQQLLRVGCNIQMDKNTLIRYIISLASPRHH